MKKIGLALIVPGLLVASVLALAQTGPANPRTVDPMGIGLTWNMASLPFAPAPILASDDFIVYKDNASSIGGGLALTDASLVSQLSHFGPASAKP